MLTGATCVGISGRVRIYYIGNFFFLNKLNQTKIWVLFDLWRELSFAKDQVPKHPLGFGLREEKKTISKHELAFSQTH